MEITALFKKTKNKQKNIDHIKRNQKMLTNKLFMKDGHVIGTKDGQNM